MKHIVELKPTPSGYARMLIEILEHGVTEEDKEFARQQIVQLTRTASKQNPKQWGKEEHNNE